MESLVSATRFQHDWKQLQHQPSEEGGGGGGQIKKHRDRTIDWKQRPRYGARTISSVLFLFSFSIRLHFKMERFSRSIGFFVALAVVLALVQKDCRADDDQEGDAKEEGDDLDGDGSLSGRSSFLSYTRRRYYAQRRRFSSRRRTHIIFHRRRYTSWISRRRYVTRRRWSTICLISCKFV